MTKLEQEKQINRFVIMCVQQYAEFSNKSGSEAYKEMQKYKIIDELENDYEDLHGFSTIWLNDYIESLIRHRQ